MAEQAAVCTRQEKNQALPGVPKDCSDLPEAALWQSDSRHPQLVTKAGSDTPHICVYAYMRGIFALLCNWLSPKDTHAPHFFLMRW